MINRRRFLLGLGGATVALPFLESVNFIGGSHARAGGGDGTPVFSVFIRQGNGVAQGGLGETERFWPRNTGALSQQMLGTDNADRALSELAGHASKLLLVRGTRHFTRGNNCDHAAGVAQCLTAASIQGDRENQLANGESIDWFLAKRVNLGGSDPLTLMSGPQQAFIAHGLSYSGPGQLRGAENNPFAVYQDLMGLGGAPGEMLEEVAARRLSVNDLVRDEMKDLLAKPNLSTGDRARLNTHFEAIRDFEGTMVCQLPGEQVDAMEAVGPNAAENRNRLEVTTMMLDLIALAFACDANRVATLQMGTGNDQTNYTINGELQNTYHRISHRVDSDGADGPAIDGADVLHHEIDRIHARHFNHLINRLSEYSGPSGGPLIDESMALWTNDLGYGPSHNHDNLPQIIAGGANGFLRTGQYVDAGNVTHNKFLNTLINAAGVRKDNGDPWDDFGDASLENGNVPEMMT